MPDIKITVKALKKILKSMLCDGDLQRTSTISHTINLINHLQAEKTNLLGKIVAKNIVIDTLKAENERLKQEICVQHKIVDERGKEVLRHDRCIRTLHERLKTIKAEAYKEFAERLKSKMNLYIFGTHCKTFTHNDIDDTLKELEMKINEHI